MSIFSSYKLRIESMLLKEEFPTNMSYLEPTINSMIVAGEGRFTAINSFSVRKRIYLKIPGFLSKHLKRFQPLKFSRIKSQFPNAYNIVPEFIPVQKLRTSNL